MAATTTQVLTATPTTLKDGSAEVTAAVWYSVQCRGNKYFYIQSAANAPGNADSAFRIGPGGILSVSRSVAADHIYVWQDDIRSDGEFSTLIIERQ